jgi:Fe2+ transport system protein FeoA
MSRVSASSDAARVLLENVSQFWLKGQSMAVSVQISADSTNETTLDRHRPGARVLVARVEGDDAITRRLMDLGFRPGTVVGVDRVAPLGDPVQYRLHGYRLALRRSEAQRVVVVGAGAASVAASQ